MKQNWVPCPIDTSETMLPDSLKTLIERMAENTHDIWAQERMQMGWVFGPERSDIKKQTPLLIPYEKLPEEEKEYDRRIAAGMLKSICCFGYELKPADTNADGA